LVRLPNPIAGLSIIILHIERTLSMSLEPLHERSRKDETCNCRAELHAEEQERERQRKSDRERLFIM